MVEPIRFEDIAARKPHLLAAPGEHQAAVESANRMAVENRLIRIPPTLPTGEVVSLAQYQTSFKDQGSRGTCYAFAACAAMEAAYKRKNGVELDLSEQYAFHLNKAGELYPDYLTTTIPHENNSSYWAFQGSSDIVDKLARAAIPEETAAPYLDGPVMEQLKASSPAAGDLVFETSNQEQLDAFEYLEAHIPTAARQAARYRVTSFAALPASPSAAQVEAVLAAGHEVVADVPGHCLLIVGFDRTRRVYSIKNSWGENRFIELSYDSTEWPILGGRYITDVQPIDAPAQWDAFWCGRWHMDHDGWRGELVIRRTTDYRGEPDAPTKLGNYYRDGERYDVNGTTAQGGQALHFWIADTTTRVQPGAQQGQEFWTYVFGWDPQNAAGTTTWSGVPYGVSLGRSSIAGTPTKGFTAEDWVGTWHMNHDGWQGTLHVDSAAPFSGSYTPAQGGPLAVNGAADSTQPHILNINIAFPDNNQPFRLLAHTWEKDVFSGVTQWKDLSFGVQGHRTAAPDLTVKVRHVPLENRRVR